MANRKKPASVPQRKSVKQQSNKMSLVPRSTQLVSAPAALAQNYRNQNPVIRSKAKETRIQHCEYIADLPKSATANFSVPYAFPIQPGNPATFPWLSAIASAYEMYRINSMRFFIRSVNASSTSGGVYMAISYDADDASPTTKQIMLAEESSMAGTFWSPMALSYIISRGKPYNERFTAIETPTGQPKKLYSAGTLYIGCDGNSTNVVGDLYCEYDITLISPSLQGFIPALFSQNIVPDPTGTQLSNTSYTYQGQNIAVPLAGSAGNGSIMFNKIGQYLVSWYVVGTGGAGATGPTFTAANGATISSAGGDNIAPMLNTATDPDSTRAIYEVLVNVLQPFATLAIAVANLATTSALRIKLAPFVFGNNG